MKRLKKEVKYKDEIERARARERERERERGRQREKEENRKVAKVGEEGGQVQACVFRPHTLVA
jgi:hypothetical protein